jgi:uncharacterized C2H2 Zn-finger protein
MMETNRDSRDSAQGVEVLKSHLFLDPVGHGWVLKFRIGVENNAVRCQRCKMLNDARKALCINVSYVLHINSIHFSTLRTYGRICGKMPIGWW